MMLKQRNKWRGVFYNGEIDKYKFDLKKHSFSTSFNESQNTNISGVQG